MANPQKENGYTAVANEILDALARTRIPGEIRQVLDVIVRLTYGWNLKHRWITYPEFTERTGLNKGNVRRAILKLIDHNLIVRHETGYSLQKDYEKWAPFSCKRVVNTDYTVVKDDYRRYSKVTTGRESILTTGTPLKPSTGAALRTPKDSIKDNKDISLRERLLKMMKKSFPDTRIPDYVPSKKIDLFLYKIERGEIIPGKVNNPVAYIVSLNGEKFPSLLEREETARKQEAQKAACRLREREKHKQFIKENSDEMKRLISSYRSQMENNNAATV